MPYKKSQSLTRAPQHGGSGYSPSKSFAPRLGNKAKQNNGSALPPAQKKNPIAPPIQTTHAFSPDFPLSKYDTRPTFLGGQYTSKVKGVSEVVNYINPRQRNQTDHDEAGEDAFNVKSYYKQKLQMRNSIEKAFKTQSQPSRYD